MKVDLWIVGKNREAWVASASEHYLARISRYCEISVHVIAESRYRTPAEIRKDETARIADRLSKQRGAFTIVLDEAGTTFNSVRFAEQIGRIASSHGALRFVIGGAYGIDPSLNKDLMMSLSAMTFPHQLVRVVFLEQLYRAFTILRGEGYHHA